MNSTKTEYTRIAIAHFKKWGYKNVTVDDLAKEMGISKKTLYSHFKDKDEIVFESVKLMLYCLNLKIKEATQQSENAVMQIIDMMDFMEQFIRGINLICYQDLQRYYPKSYKYFNTFKEQTLLEDIKENLRQGIKEGYFREDIDIDIVSRFRIESSLYTFQKDVFPNEFFNIINVANQLLAIYLYGIATPKGSKLINKQLEKKHKI